MPRSIVLIDVAVAAFVDKMQRVLISKRSVSQYKGGYSEFVGGKVEAGESAEQALLRELKEEVNLTPVQFEHFGCFEYEYPELAVRLHVYIVNRWQGELKACLNQQLMWIEASSLLQHNFPEANEQFIPQLIQKIQLL